MSEKEVRLIDANEVLLKIDKGFDETDPRGEEQIGFLKCRKIVREAPTIDLESLHPHGKWIDKGYDGDWQWRIDGRGACWHVYECSVCKVKNCGSKSYYCPHCGALMEE